MRARAGTAARARGAAGQQRGHAHRGRPLRRGAGGAERSRAPGARGRASPRRRDRDREPRPGGRALRAQGDGAAARAARDPAGARVLPRARGVRVAVAGTGAASPDHHRALAAACRRSPQRAFPTNGDAGAASSWVARSPRPAAGRSRRAWDGLSGAREGARPDA
jgi:hypothetical protein